MNRVYLFIYLLSWQLTSYASGLDKLPQSQDNGCYLIGRGPGTSVENSPELSAFLEKLTDDLKAERWEQLYKYFHARAKVRKDIGNRVDAILRHRYQKPINYSVLGIWSMIQDEGRRDVYDCPKAEGMQLISHSGYQRQYMLIYQLMSQNELGRLMFAIAPDSTKTLRIVGFHIQQWSHQGKDWLSWTEQGNGFTKAADSKSAYIFFDIAQKLLDGGTLVHYPYRKEIKLVRDQIYQQDSLVKSVQEDIGNKDIVYVGTVLSRTDTGIIVKVAIEKEYSSEDLRRKCQDIGKKLLASLWLKEVNGGVNCSFIPKGSSPDVRSKIGGYYITRDLLLPVVKVDP